MCVSGGGGGLKGTSPPRLYCTQKQERCDRGNFNLDSKASSASSLCLCAQILKMKGISPSVVAVYHPPNPYKSALRIKF